MDFHPLADIFPLIEGGEFEALVADIEAHGPTDKIVTYEGKILDGRNRYRALVRLGRTDDEILRQQTEPFVGTNPLAFVISKNLKRRHLNESQRGMVHARIATLRKGANQHTAIAVPTQADAAKLLNVSVDTGQRARRVLDHGADELVAAVDRGEVAVSVAAEVATQPVKQQREIMARGEKEILAAARKIRADRRQQKIAEARAAYEARAERGSTVSDLRTLAASGKKFAVILADRPGSSKRTPRRARSKPSGITTLCRLTRSRRFRWKRSPQRTAFCFCGGCGFSFPACCG